MIGFKNFVKEISKRSGFTQKDITDVLNTADDILVKYIDSGEEVKIFKNLTLTPDTRKGRMGHNPKTLEPVKIPDKKVVKVKISKAFKEFLNRYE